MLAWCSNYSEEGNARHTRRKEEEMNVQGGCFSRQQHVAISGRAMVDEWGGGSVLRGAGLENVTTSFKYCFFYFILLALLVFFNLRLSSSSFF